jgi:hypothetical protein
MSYARADFRGIASVVPMEIRELKTGQIVDSLEDGVTFRVRVIDGEPANMTGARNAVDVATGELHVIYPGAILTLVKDV